MTDLRSYPDSVECLIENLIQSSYEYEQAEGSSAKYLRGEFSKAKHALREHIAQLQYETGMYKSLYDNAISGVAQAWQDISTAPKDGAAFLAWIDDEGHRIAYWAHWFDNIAGKDCEGWRDYYSLDKLPDISLWQPLINPNEAPSVPSTTCAPAAHPDCPCRPGKCTYPGCTCAHTSTVSNTPEGK